MVRYILNNTLIVGEQKTKIPLIFLQIRNHWTSGVASGDAGYADAYGPRQIGGLPRQGRTFNWKGTNIEPLSNSLSEFSAKSEPVSFLSLSLSLKHKKIIGWLASYFQAFIP